MTPSEKLAEALQLPLDSTADMGGCASWLTGSLAFVTLRWRQWKVPPMQDRRGASPPVGSGNVPGNPLRSYRMSMLAHGFVDRLNGTDFEIDDSGPLSFSVVLIGNQTAPRAAGIAAFVLIIAVVIAIVAFA